MSQYIGNLTAGTKVDQSMREFINEEAAQLGVTNAELHRQLLDHYRESRENEPNCPRCGEPTIIKLTS